MQGTLGVPIVHSLYQLYQTWHNLVVTFPKSERYSLGATCQTELLAILEAVISAAGNPDKSAKAAALSVASVKLDVLRLLIRLAKDCKCISNATYLELQSKLHEVGRMLGGWLKTLH